MVTVTSTQVLNYPSKAHSILGEAASLQSVFTTHTTKIVRSLELFGEVLSSMFRALQFLSLGLEGDSIVLCQG